MGSPLARDPIDPARLWECARRLAGAPNTPDIAFLPIGLCLEDPATPRRWDYTTTPPDSVTFAYTGANGVHFSYLGGVPGAGPVVMTVPMSFDSPNLVVGADLREFLELGCRIGYRRLESLAHGWARRGLAEQAESGVPAPGPDEAELLAHLVAELDLRPWPDVPGRLDELSRAHEGRPVR
jgi:hypothetical protein